MAFARDVAISHDARQLLDNNVRQFPLLDDIYRALEWRLARMPEDGELIRDDWYVIRSQSWGASGAAIIVALCTFTDNKVEIDRIAVHPTPG